MNFDVVLDNRDFLLDGLRVTVFISALAIVISLAIGLLVGGVRAYGPRPLAAVAAVYVDVVRSIPFLVILMWLFFAPPIMLGVGLSPLWTAVAALAVHEGAYFAEIFRAGLLSVRAGQTQAGLAMGMTKMLVIRRIVVPQATIRMLPPLATYCGAIVQKSAVTSVIAVEEMTRQAQLLTSVTYRPFEIFTSVMVVYAVIVYSLIWAVEAVYKRLAPRGAS
ncbi:amino acid ABC transporter permease [Nocardioides daeguensis]|uniref:Glutamine ABC transporter permease GlnP n=1 Tax=Nocardioides daeguensis TaxID=908359 RepID=A0ABP6WAL7_9ACTN|nr:amino acid ABC transporter permease [Nocardioides daeguensis]MBV6729816.1 amino acid ABC transporter permease [Nocardioides daeguensis]MCR1775387.1 amino acid ABC transporter permease [Nocardioides daeguensis]